MVGFPRERAAGGCVGTGIWGFFPDVTQIKIVQKQCHSDFFAMRQEEFLTEVVGKSISLREDATRLMVVHTPVRPPKGKKNARGSLE
ncbi:MAG: hypothetical protein KGJ78_05400 [Alphaproteobacteria bacterium]|nr:hypothetical protein [Alphaproteobacteria bacterium]